MTEVIVYLPSKRETINSNSSTVKKKEKRKKGKQTKYKGPNRSKTIL
jgi:hypothetical protein